MAIKPKPPTQAVTFKLPLVLLKRIDEEFVVLHPLYTRTSAVQALLMLGLEEARPENFDAWVRKVP